jgi:hypothetical protein
MSKERAAKSKGRGARSTLLHDQECRPLHLSLYPPTPLPLILRYTSYSVTVEPQPSVVPRLHMIHPISPVS